MRVHLVMILNQLLDGQQGKSVGGLFEKVSNSLLLTDMPTTKEIKTTLQPDILSPPLLRLTSRKPLWLDLQPSVDIKSRWRHNWKSAQVVNSHLVCDPTIRQPGFDLPRQQ